VRRPEKLAIGDLQGERHLMIDSKEHRTPTRILLVDDEKEILDLLTSILSGGGYEIYRASDGAQALQRIEEMSFDLIITDCKMPRMTGMEFYNQAKRLSPGIDKRFLFLSAEIIPERNLAFAKESGAQVISKPFRIEEMQRVVRELLASGAAD
jgi:two-component system OmpR family response regulator